MRGGLSEVRAKLRRPDRALLFKFSLFPCLLLRLAEKRDGSFYSELEMADRKTVIFESCREGERERGTDVARTNV